MIPFHTINWNNVEVTERPGETGVARWRSIKLDNLRIRLVEYSAGYKADHWCTKGHILYCMDGGLTTELESGEKFTLQKGMSYQVSNELSSHRTESKQGATLFIVDGEFLNPIKKQPILNPWKM